MLRQKSKEFKAFFLLQFTNELIRHSGAGEVFELKNILEEETKEEQDKIKREEKRIKNLITEKKEINFLKPKKTTTFFKPIKKPFVRERVRVLRIPEPKLPPQLQYLRPIPTNIQIDLEKLNPLIKDPAVKIIECNGAEENIIVEGIMGTKKTDIILNKEEINQIIKKFSETAKIPFQEGVFKVVVGKLILLAIISEVISSKFVIKKMMYTPREIFGR